MSSDELYRSITALLPDWVMFLIYAIAALRCYLLWRRGGILVFMSPSLLIILIPLICVSLYYGWTTVTGPLPIPRLAGARGVFFGLGLGLIVMSLFASRVEHDRN